MPKIKKIVIKGILWSLFLRRNNPTKDAIVIPRVITLNLTNVNFKVSNGFVNALEFAEVKKA